MPHVTYAPAGKKDLPRLREIFLRCFGEEAGACFFPVRGRPVVRQNGRLPGGHSGGHAGDPCAAAGGI